MERVLVRNISYTKTSPIPAVYCSSFLCRLRGLSFRLRMSLNDGLLLVHKRDSRIEAAITMAGVFFALAIVWINSKEEVVDIVAARPWRPVYVPREPACYVLEMHIERLQDFRIGDRVIIDAMEHD